MKHWTPEENQILRDNWHLTNQFSTRREAFGTLATLLPLRSRSAVELKAKKLGLKFQNPPNGSGIIILPQEERGDRNRKICEMYLIGHTLDEIGTEFDLTRERCRQIIKGAGIKMAPSVRGTTIGISSVRLWSEKGVRIYGLERLRERFVYPPGEWPIRGRIKNSMGYKLIKVPRHPHANCNGYVLESRLVAEKHLKRYLKPGQLGEHVYHIDDNITNNDPENLCVFANVGYRCAFTRGYQIDESCVIWVVPKSRERMIEKCGWPEDDRRPNRRAPYIENRRAWVKRLHSMGLSLTQIVEVTGWPYRTIYCDTRELGIGRGKVGPLRASLETMKIAKRMWKSRKEELDNLQDIC